MPVVSSVIIDRSPQLDGRFWHGERHTDQAGRVYEFRALLAAGANAAALMAARVAGLDASMIADEIASNVTSVITQGSEAVPRLVHSTAAANFAALRAAYPRLTRVEAVMAGDFLSGLTNVQLQNAFSMTAGQVTTLRANKLTPAAATAVSIRAAAGE